MPKRSGPRSFKTLTVVAWLVLGTISSAMPWSRDMEQTPALFPYERVTLPPEGVLSISGEDPMSRDDGATKLTSTIPQTAATLERGKMLFDTYCAVCHGPKGAGDGLVGKRYEFPIPPLADITVERSDGHIYGTIRHGGFIMPRYAEVMTPDERWMVVHYVRSLQTP